MPICPTCHAEHPAEPGVCPDAATLPAAAPEPVPHVFDPLVGTTVADRYEIVRKIGEGGMGAVYEARHLVIGKRVALKVLLEKFRDKADLVARLLQEARLASSIGHENIVDVTDFGTTGDGRSFVVMEFLEGEPLAQLITRDAPLPVERSLRICRQVASALGAAHAKGILHRDVKPENVFLLRRADADFIKVVDFGISKAVRPGEDEADEGRLTRTGMVLGTPLYMSPEQARGEEDLDHRVDIWAVGVMLYECLTGEVPFRASNYLGIISQVLTREAPPPSQLRPELGIPAAVEAVVIRAMEKDRTRRYQLMEELERDLGLLLLGDQNVGVPAGAELAPVRGRWRWMLGLAAVLALAVGVFGALARRESEPPPPPAVPSPSAAEAAFAGAALPLAARASGAIATAPLPVVAAPAGRPADASPGRIHPPRRGTAAPTARATSPAALPVPRRKGEDRIETDKVFPSGERPSQNR